MSITHDIDYWTSRLAIVLIYFSVVLLEIFFLFNLIDYLQKHIPDAIGDVKFGEILLIALILFAIAGLIFIFKFTFWLLIRFIHFLQDRGIISDQVI